MQRQDITDMTIHIIRELFESSPNDNYNDEDFANEVSQLDDFEIIYHANVMVTMCEMEYIRSEEMQELHPKFPATIAEVKLALNELMTRHLLMTAAKNEVEMQAMLSRIENLESINISLGSQVEQLTEELANKNSRRSFRNSRKDSHTEEPESNRCARGLRRSIFRRQPESDEGNKSLRKSIFNRAKP